MTKRKRRQLIISPSLQYKFLFMLFFSLITPLIVISSWSFAVLQNILSVTSESNETIRTAIQLSLNQLLVIFIVGIGSISALFLYWGILFSNRIAGPIYRLEKEIDNMIESEKNSKVTFRKDDAFQSLAEKINFILSNNQNQ